MDFVCVVCKEPLMALEDLEPQMYLVKNAPGKEKIIPQRFHRGGACETEHAATRTGLEKVS